MLRGNPASPNTLLADQVFREIEDCVLSAKADLAAIKSPQTEYEQDVAKVQALLKDDWKRLYAAADLLEQSAIQNEIIQCARDLQLLEINYKSGLELATSKYDQRTDAVVQKLCDKLVATLGPTRIRRTFRRFEPPNLVDYLPEDRATAQLKDISSPSVVQKLEDSPTSPRTSKDRDKGATIVAKPGAPNGLKRGAVDGSSSVREAKRRATEANSELLSQRPRRSKRKNGVDDKDHGQRIATENLTPGDVYLVREQSEGWSAVLLLPTNDPNKDGVSVAFKDLGLPANPPVCYVFDRRSNTYKWRRGYEEGGPRVTKRFYPVMYFDGRSPPTRTTAWLAATRFLAYDDKVARSLDSYTQIREYLQRGTVLEEPPNDDDKTIFVNGDASHGAQRSGEIQDVHSSDSEALSLNFTRSPSASEPPPATRDTTVQEESEAASAGHSHSTKCNQTPRKSSPTPDSRGSSEISMQVQADGQSLQEERCSGRSPSLDLVTEESHVALSTQEQEQHEHHPAVQENAAYSPPTATETEPALAALSAEDDSLEKVSTDGNRPPRLDCSEAGGYPSVAKVGQLVPSAPASDGSHDIVPRPPFSSSLQTRSPELVATDPRPSESNDAERSSSAAPANGSRSPLVASLDTQGHYKGALPASETQPSRPARTSPGISHPEVPGNPSQSALTVPQPVLSRFPPPFSDASGRQAPAMRQVLPPIWTAEEMLSASQLGTKSHIQGRTLGAGTDVPVPAATASFSAWYPRQSIFAAAAPPLDTRIATPRTLRNTACNVSGGWPADSSQALVHELQRVFRRRNGLPDHFNVIPDHFRQTDNQYHCPFCSDRKWELFKEFFEHLGEHHANSV